MFFRKEIPMGVHTVEDQFSEIFIFVTGIRLIFMI